MQSNKRSKREKHPTFRFGAIEHMVSFHILMFYFYPVCDKAVSLVVIVTKAFTVLILKGLLSLWRVEIKLLDRYGMCLVGFVLFILSSLLSSFRFCQMQTLREDSDASIISWENKSRKHLGEWRWNGEGKELNEECYQGSWPCGWLVLSSAGDLHETW